MTNREINRRIGRAKSSPKLIERGAGSLAQVIFAEIQLRASTDPQWSAAAALDRLTNLLSAELPAGELCHSLVNLLASLDDGQHAPRITGP